MNAAADRSRPTMTNTRLFITLVTLGMMMLGCGGEPVAQVSGTVTLDGNPVDSATLTFQPSAGPALVAVTNATGTYQLSPATGTAGVSPGTYDVTVGTYRISVGEDGQPIEHPETIPAIYNTDSQLRQEISAGEQTIDFELRANQR